MARPTPAKLLKMQTDLTKMAEKIGTMRSDLTTMIANPMGSDVELCRQIRSASITLSEASPKLREAVEQLEQPAQLLVNRAASRKRK